MKTLDEAIKELPEERREKIYARAKELIDEEKTRHDLRLPSEWEKELGYTIIDPDGWRNEHIPWDQAISKETFERLAAPSTIKMGQKMIEMAEQAKKEKNGKMEYNVAITVKGRKVAVFDLSYEEAECFSFNQGIEWPASDSVKGCITVRKIKKGAL